MTPIQRILVPTDFSPTAGLAVDHALLLAHALDAELHLLHADVLFEHDPAREAIGFPRSEELAQRLSELIGRPAARAIPIHEEHERGISPAGVILDYAAEHEIDLIVMGSHGRSGLGRWLLGSVASQVSHHSGCPVLIVRAGEGAEARPIRRILAPTDFSQPARDALGKIRRLADELGASVVLLHAVHFPSYPDFYSAGGFSLAKDASLREGATEELARSWADSDGPEVPHELEVHIGSAVTGICRVAEEREVDLIAIAPQGVGAAERLVFGSTTEALLGRAPKPLLVLTGPDTLRESR